MKKEELFLPGNRYNDLPEHAAGPAVMHYFNELPDALGAWYGKKFVNPYLKGHIANLVPTITGITGIHGIALGTNDSPEPNHLFVYALRPFESTNAQEEELVNKIKRASHNLYKTFLSTPISVDRVEGYRSITTSLDVIDMGGKTDEDFLRFHDDLTTGELRVDATDVRSRRHNNVMVIRSIGYKGSMPSLYFSPKYVLPKTEITTFPSITKN